MAEPGVTRVSETVWIIERGTDHRVVVLWKNVFLKIFGVVLLGMGGWNVFTAVTQWGETKTPLPFTLVVLGLSAVMLYGGAVLWTNRTELTSKDGHLRVWRGPIPWPGDRVAWDQVEEIVMENHADGKEGAGPQHVVRATTTDGKQILIVRNLSREDAGVVAEQVRKMRLVAQGRG